MKKHLVEGVVPVLIELKRSLEGLRHWLLGDLLNCIRALLKDHKNEVANNSIVYMRLPMNSHELACQGAASTFTALMSQQQVGLTKAKRVSA